MKKLLCLILLFPLPFLSEAAPKVSGYISLKQIQGYTFQVTIVLYTSGNPENSNLCDTSYAKEDTIHFYWGDGSNDVLYPINGSGDSVCGCRKKYIYIATKGIPYPGPGTYRTYLYTGPRIAGIENMTNSISQNMYIFHTLIISPIGGDSSLSPVIMNPPICTYGCTHDCYSYNSGAYLPKGDSISYMLGNCLCSGGICPGYTSYNATINPTTGQLSWCNPPSIGIYNFSILMTTYSKIVFNGQPIHIPIDTEEVELEATVDTNCPTGINEISNSVSYTIFPNPSNGVFTLSLSNITGKCNVEVYNVLGEKIYNATLAPQTPVRTGTGGPKGAFPKGMPSQSVVDLSGQPNGVYFYRVVGENGGLIGDGKVVIEK